MKIDYNERRIILYNDQNLAHYILLSIFFLKSLSMRILFVLQAKKALRALKALVKLQALVRGYLVRKQTAATFYSMQALIKAQETIRAEKCRALLSSGRKFHQEELPRISLV